MLYNSVFFNRWQNVGFVKSNMTPFLMTRSLDGQFTNVPVEKLLSETTVLPIRSYMIFKAECLSAAFNSLYLFAKFGAFLGP